MNTPMDFNLPLHSRVWIYQSSRFFTPEEVKTIKTATTEFLTQWNSHGNALSAEIILLHNLFLIIAVDEATAMASGCSIDKSVRLIKELENTLNVSLTGRTTIAYVDGDENIQLKNFAEFKKEIENGTIKNTTIVFNNLLSTLADLETNWIIPANQSWLMDVQV
jgi:hypothetical protein